MALIKYAYFSFSHVSDEAYQGLFFFQGLFLIHLKILLYGGTM